MVRRRMRIEYGGINKCSRFIVMLTNGTYLCFDQKDQWSGYGIIIGNEEISTRKIPLIQKLQEEAKIAFNLWEKNPDKIIY